MSIHYELFINRNLPLQGRGCTSKAVYVSRREAQSRKRRGHVGYEGQEPYRCRYCDGWHLGHRRRRNARVRRG